MSPFEPQRPELMSPARLVAWAVSVAIVVVIAAQLMATYAR